MLARTALKRMRISVRFLNIDIYDLFSYIVLLIIALLASTLCTMSVFILNRRDNATSNSLKTKDSKTGTNATSNLIKNTESEIARKACSHSTRNLHSKKRRFNGKIHENGEECKSMINKAMESFFKELALGLGYSYLFHDLNWLTCVFVSAFLSCCN